MKTTEQKELKCDTCILYDIFVEFLSRIDGGDEFIDKLPQCNCDEEIIKAESHDKYSDVTYMWDCPIHGKKTQWDDLLKLDKI